jgi:hypothetical protein
MRFARLPSESIRKGKEEGETLEEQQKGEEEGDTSIIRIAL